jgi:hypothetical protein
MAVEADDASTAPSMDQPEPPTPLARYTGCPFNARIPDPRGPRVLYGRVPVICTPPLQITPCFFAHVGGAIAARRSQRRRRSHAKALTSTTTTHHRSRRGRSRRRRGGRRQGRLRRCLNSETESAATSAFETFHSFFPQQSGNRTSHATITTQQSNGQAGAASRSALTVRCALARLDRSLARSLPWWRSRADGFAELLSSHFCLIVSCSPW